MPPSLARWTGWLLLAVLAALPLSATAQQDGLLRLNGDTALLLDRLRVQRALPAPANGSHHPQRAKQAQALLDTAQTAPNLPLAQQCTIDRLRHEQPAPGASWINRQWGALYRDGHTFLHSKGDGYRLTLEPVYNGYRGPVQHSGSDPRAADTAWRNSRGVRATGHLGRVYFDTYASENQRQALRNEFNGVRNGFAPRTGFGLQNPEDTFYDYFDATGIIGIGLGQVDAQFGRTRRHWGYGMNSLVLTNYASPYEQLRVQATHGPFRYTTTLARFIDASPVERQREGADIVRPRRYAAFHRLAYAPSPRLTVGLFEATVFSRRDAPGAPPKAVQAHYLSPLIGVRSLQSMAGSPHNTITGLDARWQIVRGLETHAQLALNDWSVQHLGTDHWRNQWAGLVGVNLAPASLSAWSLHVEGSRIRPFFYAGSFSFDTFAHWGDPVGHSAGPNSYDVSARLAYRPQHRWRAGLWYHRTWRGRGTDERNVGGDIRRSTDTRVSDRVAMLSGIRQVEDALDVHLGFEIGPDLLIEGQLRILRTNDAETGTDTFVAPALGIRWNAPFTPRRF